MNPNYTPKTDLTKQENPYASASTQTKDTSDLQREAIDVKKRVVSKATGRVNLAILFYLGLVPLNMIFVSYADQLPLDGILLLLVPLFIFGFGAFAVYGLMSMLRSKTIAILCAVGLFIPLFGFLILLYASLVGGKNSTVHSDN